MVTALCDADSRKRTPTRLQQAVRTLWEAITGSILSVHRGAAQI
jgi:hypothetical protein